MQREPPSFLLQSPQTGYQAVGVNAATSNLHSVSRKWLSAVLLLGGALTAFLAVPFPTSSFTALRAIPTITTPPVVGTARPFAPRVPVAARQPLTRAHKLQQLSRRVSWTDEQGASAKDAQTQTQPFGTPTPNESFVAAAASSFFTSLAYLRANPTHVSPMYLAIITLFAMVLGLIASRIFVWLRGLRGVKSFSIPHEAPHEAIVRQRVRVPMSEYQAVVDFVDEKHPLEVPWKTYMKEGILEAESFYRNWYNREESMKLALALLASLNKAKETVIFETGMTRSKYANEFRERWSDGQSTLLWGKFVKEYGGTVYSVDISEAVVEAATQRAKPFGDQVQLMCSDSVKALESFDQSIDLLYIDSYDYNWAEIPSKAFDPIPAQQHALREVQVAMDKLHRDTVILVDDCGLPFGGKGGLCVDFLLSNGWVKVADAYQVLLVRADSCHLQH